MKQQEKDKMLQDLKYEMNVLQDKLDRALQIEVENDSLFNVENGDTAFVIDVGYSIYESDWWTEYRLNNWMPCKDKQIVEEFAKQTKLNWLLEKFAYDNDAVVTDDMWENRDGITYKYYIYRNAYRKRYIVMCNSESFHLSTIYFTSEEVAERAITEIVEPFERGEL